MSIIPKILGAGLGITKSPSLLVSTNEAPVSINRYTKRKVYDRKVLGEIIGPKPTKEKLRTRIKNKIAKFSRRNNRRK